MRAMGGGAFVGAYADDHGFILRLSQVARRARLGRLPADLISQVPVMREAVRAQADALLTAPTR